MPRRAYKQAGAFLLALVLVALLVSGFAPGSQGVGTRGERPGVKDVAAAVTLPPTATARPSLTPTAVPTVVASATPSPALTPTSAPLAGLTTRSGGSVKSLNRSIPTEGSEGSIEPHQSLVAGSGRGLNQVLSQPERVEAPCNETHGQVSVHSFYSPSLGREWRYRIYLPPCYEQAGRLFPVLYMFHGLNYGDSQWDTLGLDELADAGIAAGEMPPFIIVMPNIWGVDRYPNGGPGSVEQALVEDLLSHVAAHYCAWDKRPGRAIGGLSRGAFWALEIAFRHPDLFASVGGHSPAVFWDNASPQYNPYYLADDAPNLESLRIYLDVGEEDWLNKWVAQFRERLDERGLVYTFDTAPGDHNYAYWYAQAAAYLDFYTAIWPTDWRDLPRPECTSDPDAPACRDDAGPLRPCDTVLP